MIQTYCSFGLQETYLDQLNCNLMFIVYWVVWSFVGLWKKIYYKLIDTVVLYFCNKWNLPDHLKGPIRTLHLYMVRKWLGSAFIYYEAFFFKDIFRGLYLWVSNNLKDLHAWSESCIQHWRHIYDGQQRKWQGKYVTTLSFKLESK